MEHKDKLYPSLALGTLMKALGAKDVLLKTGRNGVDSLYLNETAIPLTSNGGLLIRFRGKGRTFDYVSAGDVLSDRIPGEKIKGKIVFVGTSASGLKELKPTPFDPVFPGVEVHATVVDNILKKDFISRPDGPRAWNPWSAGIGIDFRIDPGMDRSGLEFTPSWSHRGGRLAGFGLDVSKPRHFHFTGSTVDRLGV